MGAVQVAKNHIPAWSRAPFQHYRSITATTCLLVCLALLACHTRLSLPNTYHLFSSAASRVPSQSEYATDELRSHTLFTPPEWQVDDVAENSNLRPFPFTPPFRAAGQFIQDAEDKRFKLATFTWHGAAGSTLIPGGLHVQHRSGIADRIRSMGFDSVRLPYSDALIARNPVVSPSLLAANAELMMKRRKVTTAESTKQSENTYEPVRARDVYAAVVTALTDAGLAVIPANENTDPDAQWWSACNWLWFNDHLGPFCGAQQTEENWVQNLEAIMEPHVGNSLVIGADLRGDFAGVPFVVDWKRWSVAAKRVGDRLLRMNPSWLIIVGGVNGGPTLREVLSEPVELVIGDRVVYRAPISTGRSIVSCWRELTTSFMSATELVLQPNKSERTETITYLKTLPPIRSRPSEPELAAWRRDIAELQTSNMDWAFDGVLLNEDDWDTVELDFRLVDLLTVMPVMSE